MSWLRATLKVRPGEGRLVALQAGLMLVASAGGTVGQSSVDGLFLARVGAQALPYMYVALGGTNFVVARPEQEVARRLPGEYVGEMAIIGREPRTASVIAEGEVRMLCIGQKPFERILRERLETGLAVMRELCTRLRRSQEAGFLGRTDADVPVAIGG